MEIRKTRTRNRPRKKGWHKKVKNDLKRRGRSGAAGKWGVKKMKKTRAWKEEPH